MTDAHPIVPPERSGGVEFAAVHMPKAAALVADSVRRRIVRGELREGDALPPETELMQQFGISRPTLREALRILETEGLVVVRRGAGGGPRIRTPDPEVAVRYVGQLLEFQGTRVADVLTAQAALESGAVRALAEKPTKAALARLTTLLAAEEQALGDTDAFNTAAAAIHSELIALVGSPTTTLLATMLSRIVEKHAEVVSAAQPRPRPKDRGVPAWQIDSHSVHQRLLTLIEQRDGEAAARLWVAHSRANHEAMLAQHSFDTVLELLD